MILNEFLKINTNRDIEMMTGCGYIFLKSDMINKLINGELKVLIANAGCYGFNMNIEYDDIKNEEITRIKLIEEKYYLLV
ncbi:hypothetical protein I5677_16690 [Mobilitalea sibirica]|uniref:Uncharacterized protein n=1 Tax=Mobilitalea sibirica TaxID=1462919 RepID=A0A8J7HDV0_9FIRM|nr:hypothetical protein [Mobilitalea sibirica]MBH1942532.1 hypothetical protein [Mobilitalea sibirica]